MTVPVPVQHRKSRVNWDLKVAVTILFRSIVTMQGLPCPAQPRSRLEKFQFICRKGSQRHFLTGQIGCLVRIFGHRSTANGIGRQGVPLNEHCSYGFIPVNGDARRVGTSGQVAFPLAKAIGGCWAQRSAAPHRRNDRWPDQEILVTVPGPSVSIVRVYSIGVNVAVTVCVCIHGQRAGGPVPLHHHRSNQ